MLLWSEKGLLSGISTTPGRGVSRSYSRQNLLEIALINELLQFGISFNYINLLLNNSKLRHALELKKQDKVLLIRRISERKEGVERTDSDASQEIIIETVNNIKNQKSSFLLGPLTKGEKVSSCLTTSSLIVNLHLLVERIEEKIKLLT